MYRAIPSDSNPCYQGRTKENRKSLPFENEGQAFILGHPNESVIGGCSDRADSGAGAALYTQIGIDLVLAIAFGNGTYGAFCCACATGDACIGNAISH